MARPEVHWCAKAQVKLYKRTRTGVHLNATVKGSKLKVVHMAP